MRIAIVGTGGVGGLFGGRLAQAGEDVTFIARGEHLRAIQADGLRVESADGDFVVRPARATDDPAEVGPVDVALVAVKGWQVPEAIGTLRPLVGPETLIVPLLNGVEAPDELAAAFGEERVAGGLCGCFASLVGPGHIRNVAARTFVTIGELDHTRTARIERLAEALARTPTRSSVADDIHAALWEKLAFVGPFGGVGAVARVPVGSLRSVPQTRALLEGAMTEVIALAGARGVSMAEGALARALAIVDASPAEATASMQRDIMAGRPSELESQIGAVVRLAGEVGAAVPIHTYLYASLLPQERQARGADA